MGGAITLNYAVHGTYKDSLAGYLAFAPMIQVHPNTMPSLPLRMAMPVAAWLLPGLRFKPHLAPEELTHSERWQKRFADDSDARVVTSASQINDAFKRGRQLLDPKYVAKIARKPISLFHSTADTVNDFDSTLKFFELLPESVPLKEFYEYSDFRHSLPHETPDRLYRIFNDVVNFLEKAIALSQKS